MIRTIPNAYVFRSLLARPWRTLATAGSIAGVTGVLCYLLAFAQGLRAALARSADPRSVIVLADGATAESNSAIDHADFQRLLGIPKLQHDPVLGRLVSAEVVVQTGLARPRSDGSRAGVVVRGVELDRALSVRPDVALVEGRWFRRGADELVAGASAARRFPQARLGARVECGERTFTVVGTFRAAGGACEGELWGHRSNVADAHRRERYSSVRLRLADDSTATVEGALDRIASAAVGLRGVPAARYFAAQADAARVIESAGVALAALMGLGAAFAAANAVHASVAGRTRELVMLRTVGFRRSSILAAILAESAALALAGGAIGCAACAVLLTVGGAVRDFGDVQTFSSVAFALRLGPRVVVESLAAATTIGLIGGAWPACRAAALPLAGALRRP